MFNQAHILTCSILSLYSLKYNDQYNYTIQIYFNKFLYSFKFYLKHLLNYIVFLKCQCLAKLIFISIRIYICKFKYILYIDLCIISKLKIIIYIPLYLQFITYYQTIFSLFTVMNINQ